MVKISGDGLLDIIAGAPGGAGPDNDRSAAGEIAVVFGRLGRDSRTVDLSVAGSEEAIIVYSMNEGSHLGFSVATADVNGDGNDDLLAAGWGLSGPLRDRWLAGEINVLHGPFNPLPRDLRENPPDLIIYGAQTGDLVGGAICDGDVNGDTIGDILLSVPWGDGPDGTRGQAGELAIIFGASP